MRVFLLLPLDILDLKEHEIGDKSFGYRHEILTQNAKAILTSRGGHQETLTLRGKPDKSLHLLKGSKERFT